MLNLTAEIEAFRDSGAIPPAEAARLIARERREIFSIHPELRALSWIGAILIATGAGVLLSRNLDRIGPVALATAVGLAAAAAYAYALWRLRSGSTSLVDDYVLLLGALLSSADLAYIEGQFHLLDQGWSRHLIILAVIHGATAYVFASRTLLSLSVVALAAWMGVEQRVDKVFDSSIETAVRALVCSATILLWRFAHVRLETSRDFARVFEHFAANLAFLGGLVFAFNDDTWLLGVGLTLVFTAVVTIHAFAQKTELFAIYAYVYGVVAIFVACVNVVREDVIGLGVVAIVFVTSIAGLFRLHHGFKRRVL